LAGGGEPDRYPEQTIRPSGGDGVKAATGDVKGGLGQATRPTESSTADAALLEYGGVRLDAYRHRAFAGMRELDLTPMEFCLLKCLLRQAGQVCPRALLAAAARRGRPASLRTIDQHVKWLRRKIGRPALIQTVWGVGYRLTDGGPAALSVEPTLGLTGPPAVP
jgi:DNA-binding response OmpR family regulator